METLISKKIELDFTSHRGNNVVLIKFLYDSELANCARKINNATWSQTKKSWYVPYTDQVLHDIKRIFDPICEIDARALKVKIVAYKKDPQNKTLAPEVLLKIEAFKKWLLSKRYSESTVGTYTDALRTFLKFYHDKPVSDISNEDVIEFNNQYILANNLSSSYQNQVVNAIKLFFKTIENKAIDLNLVHRPKRYNPLPNVLSKQEVKKILEVHSNIKHKTMLSLIYACGLRRSELLNLKPENIDSERGLIIIKEAKGKKDRIAPISDKIIKMLREYYKTYKPGYWLFEGQNKGEQYTAESLQSVLKQALVKTKINKPVSLHWLRHSYATHLLESGTDLRYIQELLGHKSSRTTEIYTHVSAKSIQKIKSPFDDL
jgi:integrase/recombinase XerD